MFDDQDQNGGIEAHLAALDSGQWSELEGIVARFELACRAGASPNIAEYLPPDNPARTAVLLELIATDLEWRWQNGLIATTEDYLSRFPELRSNPPQVVQLATSEFIARRRAGSPVDADEFARRFPQLGQLLRASLFQAATTSVDSEAFSKPHRSAGVVDEADRCTETPRVVGRYKLVREIGRGAFGTVYEAVDTELGRRVAIKLPRHVMASHGEGATRLVREAQNLARLSHSAIVPVLDAGWFDGIFYIVCSLVEGPTLADRIRDQPLPQHVVAEIIAALCDALAHAHDQGVVHRDVKPGNILFDAQGSPWLTDFGLASYRGADATLTIDGQLLGTPAYMSPEQAAGAAHKLDGRSDVYSLGVVLYEALTGQAPFTGSPSAVLEQIRICDPLPPSRICPQINRDLEMICLKALEKRPVDRYPTAAAMADDLRRFLAGEPTRARPPSTARRLVKWARRRPAMAVLVGVSLVSALALTSLVSWHNVRLRGALMATDDARRQAEELQRASEQSRRQTEGLLYAADIRLAANACLNGDRAETMRRLLRHVAVDEAADRREFAWRRLWSVCHADRQTLSGHEGDVYQVRAIGRGNDLVSSGRDGSIRLWNVPDGRGRILAHYPDELGVAVVSPDGGTLAAGGDGGAIGIWDLVAGRETRQVSSHAKAVLCGAISPRGDQLATAGRDNVIRLWMLPGGEPVSQLTGHSSTIESLAYLPGGNTLVSTGKDCTLRLWDLEAKSGAVMATHPLPAYCVACSHDGRSIATGSVDYSVYLWDVETRSLRGRLSGHTEAVQCVAFSPDESRLASTGRDGTLRIWNLDTLKQEEQFIGHTGLIWSLTWFPDNVTLASAGGDGTVRLWRRGTSQLQRAVSVPAEVDRVSFTADGRRVRAAVRKQGTWEVDADDAEAALPTAVEKSWNVASARNADVMAALIDKRRLRIDRASSPSLTFSVEPPMELGRIALSPAGDLLATSTAEPKVYLYELPSFHLRWSHATPGQGVATVEFNTQGDELLVNGGESWIGIYDVADGAPRLAFRTHQSQCVTTSPMEKWLAVGCSDRAIRVWDAHSGIEANCLQGHDGAIRALAFSPDGQTLAAGTSAGSITLWHVASWQELGTFKTSLASINHTAFSGDGMTLAIGGRTADDAGQVLLWKTKPIED